MSSTPHDPFYSSPFGPFYRRHTPYMVQPEYRVYEMNKRLQSRTEVSTPTLGVCLCNFFFFFFFFLQTVHELFLGGWLHSVGSVPLDTTTYVEGNERQEGSTSLNAGF